MRSDWPDLNISTEEKNLIKLFGEVWGGWILTEMDADGEREENLSIRGPAAPPPLLVLAINSGRIIKLQ